MPTPTTRLSLQKQAGAEFIDVQYLNDAFDRIDANIGVIWVNDGVVPPLSDIFDGAIVRERTSMKAWVALKTGVGTYIRKWISYPWNFLNSGYVGGAFPGDTTWRTMQMNSAGVGGQNFDVADYSVSLGVAVPVSGYYDIFARVNYPTSGTGNRGLRTTVTSTANRLSIQKSVGVNQDYVDHVNSHVQLGAGTRVLLETFQTSGAALAPNDCFLSIKLIEVIQ